MFVCFCSLYMYGLIGFLFRFEDIDRFKYEYLMNRIF
jgi:hypothetical protein